MGNYRSEDGLISWSAWWKAEASEEYKEYLRECHDVDESNEENARAALRNYFKDTMRRNNGVQVASELRMFIRKLYEESQNDQYDRRTPVWKSLLEINSDATLFRITSLLLPEMWT